MGNWFERLLGNSYIEPVDPWPQPHPLHIGRGKQAPPAVVERMDKLPPKALLRAARAMGEGMKYENEDGWAHWRTQGPEYHLNRALRHVRLWQSGDTSEDHVGHVISRILMWGDLVE